MSIFKRNHRNKKLKKSNKTKEVKINDDIALRYIKQFNYRLMTRIGRVYQAKLVLRSGVDFNDGFEPKDYLYIKITSMDIEGRNPITFDNDLIVDYEILRYLSTIESKDLHIIDDYFKDYIDNNIYHIERNYHLKHELTNKLIERGYNK